MDENRAKTKIENEMPNLHVDAPSPELPETSSVPLGEGREVSQWDLAVSSDAINSYRNIANSASSIHGHISDTLGSVLSFRRARRLEKEATARALIREHEDDKMWWLREIREQKNFDKQFDANEAREQNKIDIQRGRTAGAVGDVRSKRTLGDPYSVTSGGDSNDREQTAPLKSIYTTTPAQTPTTPAQTPTTAAQTPTTAAPTPTPASPTPVISKPPPTRSGSDSKGLLNKVIKDNKDQEFQKKLRGSLIPPQAGVMGMLPYIAMGATPAETLITNSSTLLIKNEGLITTPKFVLEKEAHRTVGIGHFLDGSKRSRAAVASALPKVDYTALQKGLVSLTQAQAKALFKQDLPAYITRARSKTDGDSKTPIFDRLSPNLQKFLVDSTYRGGWGYSTKARASLRAGDFKEAAKEFIDSEEYRLHSTYKASSVKDRMDATRQAILDEETYRTNHKNWSKNKDGKWIYTEPKKKKGEPKDV
jgi:hypothetical protein